MANDDMYVPHKFGLIATVVIALVPGITFFILVPSLLFSYFEGWPLTLSIYYSYVTTTTIGFGDYVPTFQSHQARQFGAYFVLYQIFIIIWFIFSLGYLVMIMTFITRGLRSKRLFELEQQLKDQIKVTQHKIWTGVTKDVSYLRHILNELYINAKPLYIESDTLQNLSIPKSCSCPDLELASESIFECISDLSRKRAFSESFDQLLDANREQLANGTPIHRSLLRVSSDTDLHKINKEKTIDTVNSFKETTNLLAKVVSALNNINSPLTLESNNIYGTYNGFSNLFNDRTLPKNQNNKQFKRARAQSDFYLNPKKLPTSIGNEWTWGGDNNQIQQVINQRARLDKNNGNVRENSSVEVNSSIIDENSYEALNVEENVLKKKKRKFSTDSLALMKRLLLFKKRDSHNLSQHNEEKKSCALPVTSIKLQVPMPDTYAPSSRISKVDNREKNVIRENSNERTISHFANEIGKRRHSLFVTSEMLTSSASKSGIKNEVRNQRKVRSGSLFQRPSNSKLFSERGYSFCDPAIFPSRSSISTVKEEDLNLLEQTTLADIIRAIETLHAEALTTSFSNNGNVNNRKIGTVTPPYLPSVLTLFNNRNNNTQNVDNHILNRRETLNNITVPNALKTNNERRWSRSEILNDNLNQKYSGNKSAQNMRTKSETLQEDPELRRKLTRFSIRLVKEKSLLNTTEIPFKRSSKSNVVGRQSLHARTPLSRIAQMQSMRKNSTFNMNGTTLNEDENI